MYDRERGESPPAAKRAVVLYSRRDARIREELDPYLRPLEQHHKINRLDDTRIGPGLRRRDEVVSALNHAHAAVLLVSHRFLASPFILGEELPPLLHRAARGGVAILSLILTPCAFERSTFLRRHQVINDPSYPLSGLRRHNREAVYDRLAKLLEDVLR